MFVCSNKNFIKRIRKTLLPPLPRTFTELGEALENYAPARNIYKEIVKRGGASAVIFASNEMLASLKRALWLYIDGTFWVSHHRNLVILG